jgi:hypothetical protein
MTKYERIQTALGIGQIVVLIATAVFVILQLHHAGIQIQQGTLAHKTTLEMDKRARALEFIKRFNEEPILTMRSKAASAIRQGKFNDDSCKHDVQAYLNYFEEMALAVSNDLAHEEICLRFFRSPLNYLCSQCDPFLKGNPSTYVHLKTLNEKWKAKPKPIESLE